MAQLLTMKTSQARFRFELKFGLFPELFLTALGTSPCGRAVVRFRHRFTLDMRAPKFRASPLSNIETAEPKQHTHRTWALGCQRLPQPTKQMRTPPVSFVFCAGNPLWLRAFGFVGTLLLFVMHISPASAAYDVLITVPTSRSQAGEGQSQCP